MDDCVYERFGVGVDVGDDYGVDDDRADLDNAEDGDDFDSDRFDDCNSSNDNDDDVDDCKTSTTPPTTSMTLVTAMTGVRLMSWFVCSSVRWKVCLL